MKQNNNEIPEGYKMSTLGVIPQEWEVKRLGEVCDIFVGRDLKENKYSKRQNEEYKYKVYSNTVQNFGLYGYYDFEEYPKYAVTVIGRGIGLGTAFPRHDGFGAIGRLLVLFSKYFNYIFLSEYINAKINFLVESAAIPQLTGEQIASYGVVVPSLYEQEKIADILSLWESAIEKQSALVDALSCCKRALMQQLLTTRKRLPNFNEPWATVTLGEIGERITRKNIEGNTNVMTISAQRGFVNQTDFFNKSIASATLDNYFLVFKDEFCYNKSYCNGYPMGAIKRLHKCDKAVVTTLYICFRIKSKDCSVGFLEQYFESGVLNEHLMKIANEGGRAHGLLNVTPSDFFAIKFMLPKLAEQQAIAEVLSTADQEIELAKKRLDSFRIQKRGLMQQLLTGKKRVKR